ncbi:hypothetical protein JOE63_003033 [Cellulosimicrobium cellulans]|jgi:hypothetical protein|uniref:Uncharacterized protein n=1 Tax=Cellulosimicrobium cellulans TaxID=1710 RepID=A0A1Y0HQR8_CELCE|nr:DUF6191 domain-containing protein [Cellulosimicrobium cellulans]ARU50290.1 hypothetical protein CBR64_00940 [Cellulosimicrobium cellulans]MBM7820556.1 hypothetical protein [Cellulosimicrobium cellulans]
MLQGIGAQAGGVLVVVALTVLLVVGITRFTSGAEARARRDAGAGESASSGMFGEIVEIFQPSRTHVTEEKERQRLDIVQRPAEGRPFDVDLDDGVFYVPAGTAGPARPDTDAR